MPKRNFKKTDTKKVFASFGTVGIIQEKLIDKNNNKNKYRKPRRFVAFPNSSIARKTKRSAINAYHHEKCSLDDFPCTYIDELYTIVQEKYYNHWKKHQKEGGWDPVCLAWWIMRIICDYSIFVDRKEMVRIHRLLKKEKDPIHYLTAKIHDRLIGPKGSWETFKSSDECCSDDDDDVGESCIVKNLKHCSKWLKEMRQSDFNPYWIPDDDDDDDDNDLSRSFSTLLIQ